MASATPDFNSQRRLKLIGTTRWSSNQDAIDSIIGKENSLFVLIKPLLKVCSLDNLKSPSLFNAGNNLNLWILYDNVVVTFILHKKNSLITPTTKFLQKMGLNILDGYKSLKACNQKLEISSEQLDEYFDQADQFIKNTNLLLNDDKEIESLKCDCLIRIPLKDEKEKKINRIKGDFRNFIQTLQDGTDDRLLCKFDEGVHHEMLLLDPLFAEKMFSSDDNSIFLKRLCEINNIKDENGAMEELKIFTAEYIEIQDCLNESKENIEKENESDLEVSNSDQPSVEVQLMKKKNVIASSAFLNI